jgi:hypothetical protein
MGRGLESSPILGLKVGEELEPRRETEIEVVDGVADNVCAISCHGDGCLAILVSCANGRNGVVGEVDLGWGGRSSMVATGDIFVCGSGRMYYSGIWYCIWYCMGMKAVIAFAIGFSVDVDVG